MTARSRLICQTLEGHDRVDVIHIMQDARAYGCSGHTAGGKYLCGNGVRVKREVAEAVLLTNIKKRLLSDEMTAYVEKQFRAAIRDMGAQEDAPAIESERAGIERKIEKVLDAIERLGISDSLAERLRKLEAETRDAGERLKAAQIDVIPLERPTRPRTGASGTLARSRQRF